ncbi:unnamed protein product [Arctia plantaginis]|uniref:Stress-activated map kinase-interacting protein 1 n=1 Tax=Arctia plantaginis TaxID=874455 RepID=A0A8S1BBK0_ARCPL|nr:unnamed protein product [Arctia plantaginis]CAB3259170.1 unnamed protein product [Arctia plantaginis]
MAGEDFSKIFQNKSIEEKNRIRDGRLNQPGPSKGKDAMGDISEEDVEKEIVTRFDPYPDMDDSEDDDPLCDSYVRNDPGFGGRYDRNRTNTGQWLDKKEQALKKAAKIKIIKWEDSSPLTADQLAEAFSKCEVKKPEKTKSLLTQQLQNCPNLPHRQYLEYAKFDGTAQLGLPIKSFKIFMTMLPEKHQNYPLVVCVIASAKIKDLIGFTCYKYSIEHPDISLGSVHDYGLCIAEDDGEVDWAFPCLDANEPCSKFGFTCLGLIELKNKTTLCPAPMPIPEDGMSGAFHVFPKAENSSHSNQNPSRLNTGDSSTSEAVISALKALNEGEPDLNKIQSHIMATEAPQYKAYKVQLLRKVRTNTSVQLGISLDRIEVEPLVTNKHAFWSRSKYFLHSIDSVAWCQILETRGNRTTFRIVYSPSHNATYNDRISTGQNTYIFHPNTAYKIQDFETDHEVAKEIVEKVNTILDLRNSPCRREYKTAKDKKLQTRRSFHTKHLS